MRLCVLLIGAMALVGCAKPLPTLVAVKPASTVPPPSICEQVLDHIDAYITYVGCEHPDGGIGYFPSIAETEPRSGRCTAVNEVDRIPYRAPEVNQVVLTVMRRELNGKGSLHLFNAVRAIWIAALEDTNSPDGEEANRQLAQSELRRLVHSVPWLTGNLVDRIMAELGSDEVCLRDRRGTVDISQLPKILAAMSRIESDTACPVTRRGLFRVKDLDLAVLDPNIAVAIARLQGPDLYKVPTEASVRITLESMGLTLTLTTAMTK